MICLASARVHLEVKAAAGSNACWVCFVGRGKPGVGAGICPPLGGSEGVFAWADGTARKTEAATAAASAAATERHRSFRCVLGCSCIFALLAELRPFVEDGRVPSFPETPAAPMTPQASSRTPSCRGDGTSVGPRRVAREGADLLDVHHRRQCGRGFKTTFQTPKRLDTQLDVSACTTLRARAMPQMLSQMFHKKYALISTPPAVYPFVAP